MFSEVEPKTGPKVSPRPWQAIKSPEMLSWRSSDFKVGWFSSTVSIISGSTGMIIIPQPKPIIAKPSMIKVGEL